MAGATHRTLVSANWTKIGAAGGREAMALIDATGNVEIAVADGEQPHPGLVAGHKLVGQMSLPVRGAEIVWARGAGVYVCLTLLKRMGDAEVDDPKEAMEAARAAQATATAADAKATDAQRALSAPYQPFASRAAAEAATIPALVSQINVAGLQYVRDPEGTALTTAGAVNWSPDGDVFMGHYGVKADGSDETDALTACLLWAADNGRTVHFEPRRVATRRIDFSGLVEPRVYWRGVPGSEIYSLDTEPLGPGTEVDAFIRIHAHTLTEFTISSTINANDSEFTIDPEVISHITPNDTLLAFGSDRVIETDDRGQARHGMVIPVSKIVGNTITIARPMPVELLVGDSPDYTVTSFSTENKTITVAGLIGETVNRARYRLVFRTVGGEDSAANLLPSEFNPATGQFTFAKSLPSGLVVGDTLYIKRQVSVNVFRSSKVDIDGVRLARPVTSNATPEQVGFRGLVVGRGYEPRVTNLETVGFSTTGCLVENSYKFHLGQHTHYYCNRAYSGSDGTGYGVSIAQSSFGRAENITGVGCRRTLDVGGTQMVSHDNEIYGIRGYTSGAGYTGDLFWPRGPLISSVTGSHGGARGTRYCDVRGVTINTVVNLRGMEETVRGVYGAGEIEAMIHSFAGDGADVDGVYYTSGRPDWSTDADMESKYTLAGKLETVLKITSRNIDPLRPHHLMNVTARGITDQLVTLVDGGNAGAITVGGNIDLTVDNERGNRPEFYVIRHRGSQGPATVKIIRLGSMSILNNPDAPKSDIYWVHHESVKSPNPMRLPNGSFFIELADDTATQINIERNTQVAKVSLYCAIRNRPFKLVDGLVEIGSAGNRSPVPASSGVEILGNVALTGTTGTDGDISLSIPLAIPRKLHVENRFGNTQMFIIECSTAV